MIIKEVLARGIFLKNYSVHYYFILQSKPLSKSFSLNTLCNISVALILKLKHVMRLMDILISQVISRRIYSEKKSWLKCFFYQLYYLRQVIRKPQVPLAIPYTKSSHNVNSLSAIFNQCEVWKTSSNIHLVRNSHIM